MRRHIMLFSAAALCLSLASSARASSPISEEARLHFEAGVNLLQDPDGARFEEAYREFKTAYAATPSWKILGNLGICAMKLERDSEAIDAFKRYLSEGGDEIEAEDRVQFSRDLKTLEAGVVRVTFTSRPPGATLVDERIPAAGAPVQNVYEALGESTTIGVRPGRHRFTARLAGRADAVWEVELSPRQTPSHVFDLPSRDAAPGTRALNTARSEGNGVRLGSYVAMGVGVLGVGAGAYFGVSARSKYDAANALCEGAEGTCRLSAADAQQRTQLGEDGDGRKTLSLVGFIAGGVGLATGVSLFLLSGKKRARTDVAHVEGYVGLGALGMRGNF